jgi:hypothetical protein
MARCFVSFAARGVALDAFGGVCMAEGSHSIRLSLRNILLLGVLMLAAASTGIISIGSAFIADDLRPITVATFAWDYFWFGLLPGYKKGAIKNKIWLNFLRLYPLSCQP